MEQTATWGDLLCRVTGKPFYPVRKTDDAMVCSECGEVFIPATAARAS